MLEIANLNVWYGAAQALFGVSLTVGRGELVVLQGLNGAGKSTLLQAIMGLSPHATGTVSYQKSSISGLEPHAIARLGLGYVPEDRRLFTGLTVLENLHIAARVPRPDQAYASVLSIAAQQERVLLLFPALKNMLGRKAAHMSGGEQQMLSIARTLMTSPALLLLDEPCEGIAPVLVESIRDALLQLKGEGMPMLVAEQNAILSSRADRVITLVAGQIANTP